MTRAIQNICWPATRLGEALEALGRTARIRLRSGDPLFPPESVLDGEVDSIDEWLQLASAALGVEARPVETTHPQLSSFLQSCAPAILRVEFEGAIGFVLITGVRRGTARILCPDLRIAPMPLGLLRDALARPLEAPLQPEVEEFADRADLGAGRGAAVIRSIIGERLMTAQVRGFWLLGTPSSQRLMDQLRESGVIGRFALFLGARTLQYLLFLACWAVIGTAALEGRFDAGWLAAWVLLLLTGIPLDSLTTWLQGRIAVTAGAVLKRRLLTGSLRLRPEEIRNQGAGQLLGRVIESNAVESLALTGGLAGFAAILESIVAATVLVSAAKSTTLAILFVAWTCLLLMLGWRYFRDRERWTTARLEITNDFVERMVGHRTRLAQEPRDRWHEGEDEALQQYLRQCNKVDGSLLKLVAIIPRGWLLVSLLVLARSFVSESLTSGELAVAFGGIILAQGALKSITESVSYLSGAAIAWKKVKLLFEAGSREEMPGSPAIGLLDSRSLHFTTEPVMDAHDLAYGHQGRAERTLAGCSLRVQKGDRILLEGPSGGGKSTLASILAGLREPQSGLMIIGGLDRQTLGLRAWRRVVACAPQFHENHIFAGTLAFNLLMGRHWPPTEDDLQDAENLCRELGLGDLLDRMPAGLQQTIGETGWQLSYGERCRVFLARALLQGAELIILDESFGALDPDTLQKAAECVRKWAPTLMIIAHP